MEGKVDIDKTKEDIDAMVCGNRAPITRIFMTDTTDLYNKRLYAYYQKLKELRVA